MAENQDSRNAQPRGNEQRQMNNGFERQQGNSGGYRNRNGRNKPYQGNKAPRDGNQQADGQQKQRRFGNDQRQGQGNRGNRPFNPNGRQNRADFVKNQPKPLETAEDIAKDTERLEKEIALEINEIKAMVDSL